MTAPMHQASDELGGALRRVEQEMEQAEAMLVHLQQRLAHLRRAASGLRGLLGLPDDLDERRHIPPGAVIRRDVTPAAQAKLRARRDALAHAQAEASAAEREAARAAERAVAERAAADRVAAERAAADRAAAGDHEARPGAETAASEAGADDGDDGVSSTDRVIELLREYSPRSVPRAAVLHEFQRRGWIEDTWSKPDAAVRMAIQRALKRGEAELVDGGRLIHRDASLFADVHVEGGDA